ncbi:hypothetical protein [Thermus caliditerrae]|uniref:hypothetical protein n=1 Tax=Thermus caliditerrae TaxID=1330700 RepID=UPI001F42FBBB|nr:hypothetical protein [Thermus caliditerrae]
MRSFMPFLAGVAFFVWLLAVTRFAFWGFGLALLGALLAYLGVERWQGGLLRRGPSPVALERLAMKEAWRRGGLLRPRDLAPFLPEARARELLEGLAERGLCRRDGEGFRF